jgi:hypothetical protein
MWSRIAANDPLPVSRGCHGLLETLPTCWPRCKPAGVQRMRAIEGRRMIGNRAVSLDGRRGSDVQEITIRSSIRGGIKVIIRSRIGIGLQHGHHRQTFQCSFALLVVSPCSDSRRREGRVVREPSPGTRNAPLPPPYPIVRRHMPGAASTCHGRLLAATHDP